MTSSSIDDEKHGTCYPNKNSTTFTQEIIQVGDHRSLPLDTQCSKRRVIATRSNIVRVDVGEVIVQPLYFLVQPISTAPTTAPP
uniref:Uncharacterized protein n=1 Tax=Arundo donax TaxID=35708 RepID=A0A0A9GNH8_ARUDO